MSAKKTNPLSDTAIIIENNDWRIKVYLGLGGLVALVILGFLYRVEVGLIVLAIGTATAARMAFVGWHRYRLARFEQRRLEAEVSKAEAEAVKAKAESFFVEKNAGVFVLDGIAVAAFYPAVSASRLLADVPTSALPEPAAPMLRRLLDLEYCHLLVVGPTGSGKSTVMAHLIDNERGDTEIMILDPHAGFNLWPGRANRIVGGGRDYQTINQELIALLDRMNRRYNGEEGTAQRVLIVIDEWLSVVDRCPDGGDFFRVVGSESRKVNMSLLLSSISNTIDDMNVSGPVRDNFSQVSLSPSLKAKNQALLRLSRKDTELIELPGVYRRAVAMIPAPNTPPALIQAEAPDFDPLDPSINSGYDFDSGPSAPAPDPTELRIFELYLQGKSLNAIWKEVYPDRSYGGVQANELKAILAKFGVRL